MNKDINIDDYIKISNKLVSETLKTHPLDLNSYIKILDACGTICAWCSCENREECPTCVITYAIEDVHKRAMGANIIDRNGNVLLPEN